MHIISCDENIFAHLNKSFFLLFFLVKHLITGVCLSPSELNVKALGPIFTALSHSL